MFIFLSLPIASGKCGKILSRKNAEGLFYKKLDGGVKFFILVLGFYFLLFFINYNIAEQVFFNFWEMIKKIIPLLGLVFIVMVIVDIIFTKERTIKYLGKNAGIKSWIYLIIGGILTIGPPYVEYPMLGELKKKGMGNYLIAVFLFNRNVKIAFLPALVYYFSMKYAIVFSIYIILFSILNGLLIKLFVKEEN